MQLRTVQRVGSVMIRLNAQTGIYFLAFWDKDKLGGRGGRVHKSTGIRATTARQVAGSTVPGEVVSAAKELNGRGRIALD